MGASQCLQVNGCIPEPAGQWVHPCAGQWVHPRTCRSMGASLCRSMGASLCRSMGPVQLQSAPLCKSTGALLWVRFLSCLWCVPVLVMTTVSLHKSVRSKSPVQFSRRMRGEVGGRRTAKPCMILAVFYLAHECALSVPFCSSLLKNERSQCVDAPSRTQPSFVVSR